MIDIVASTTTTTLVIGGDLDLAARDHFPAVAARVAELDGAELVVDLCRATFIDSTGAAFLMSLADDATRRGQRALLRGAQSPQLFVLEVVGALELYELDREHRCPEG